MSGTERLRDDLAYVRAAVERQREALCRVIPMWFAALIAAFMVALAVIGDLRSQGLVPDAASDLLKTIGFAGLVTILLSRRFRRDRGSRSATTPAPGRRQQMRQAIPFLIFAAGLAFIQIYASESDIADAAFRPVLLSYVAVGFMLIGHGGLRLLFWMGAGLAVATLGYVAFDTEFKRTLLGLGFSGGVMLGSWLDRRLLDRTAD